MNKRLKKHMICLSICGGVVVLLLAYYQFILRGWYSYYFSDVEYTLNDGHGAEKLFYQDGGYISDGKYFKGILYFDIGQEKIRVGRRYDALSLYFLGVASEKDPQVYFVNKMLFFHKTSSKTRTIYGELRPDSYEIVKYRRGLRIKGNFSSKSSTLARFGKQELPDEVYVTVELKSVKVKQINSFDFIEKGMTGLPLNSYLLSEDKKTANKELTQSISDMNKLWDAVKPVGKMGTDLFLRQ